MINSPKFGDGLKFESDTKIEHKDYLWMDTTSHLKNADYVQGQGASR